MNTYRFYEQGGTHVLGTFDNDTLLGERTFNTKRLEAVEYQGKIDVKDKVTEKYILKEQVYTNILKEDGTTWGDNVTNSVTALNIFLNSIPYNIADLQDIPYPKVNNGYLKFQDGEYDWGALSVPSPPPENTDFLDEGVTNLYFTEDRARDSVSATGSLNYDSETGVFSYTQGDTDTVSEGITNLYYTNDRVDERINLAIGDLTAFLNRYNAEAAANKLLASTDTVIVEKYLTVQADGHGESITAQSDTPTSGNKIIRKIWHKAVSFEDSDVTTWTLVHTFADDTTYNNTIATFNALLTAATYGSIPFTLAQTWEEAAAVSALLDGYTADLVGAFAPCLLVPDYEGACMRVRRSGDNAEQDIGFDGIDLDRDAIASFCSPGDGFVVTWYDQSGGGKDVTNATTSAQPKIYDASTGVELDNAMPATTWSGSNVLNASVNLGFSSTNARSVFQVLQKSNSGNAYRPFQISTNTSAGRRYRFTTDWGIEVVDGFRVWSNADTTQVLLSLHFPTGSTAVEDHVMYKDGNLLTPILTNAEPMSTLDNPLIMGEGFVGKIQAQIFYAADKSADRVAIETAINDYFNIY